MMDKVFSVFHKEFYVPKDDFIVPIVVGNNASFFPANGLRDNTGDNISQLNPYYCELTAMYWIWKNYDQHADNIIGLVHYRRYFYKHSWVISKIARLCRKFEIGDYLKLFTLSKYSTIQLLNHKRIIVPILEGVTHHGIRMTNKEEYALSHFASDWELIKEIISTSFPAYLRTFERFENSNVRFNCNMFITRRKDFDAYCAWLFPLLDEFYKRTTISEDPYQARVVGFIAERIINVYVMHNYEEDEIEYMEKSFIDENR